MHVYGAKEDESSTGHIWTAGFHRGMAHSRLARVLKLMNRISLIFKFFLGHGKPWITENADTESIDTVHTCILLILINIVELGKLTKCE
jgi:hypothetical protein